METNPGVAPSPTLSAREGDDLVQTLTRDFPLHTRGELRRAVDSASEALWPNLDRAKILDEVRRRLESGIFS